eukprot:gene17188-18918_t
MTREPMKVEFKDDCKPYAVHNPIPVPHHWKERVKEDLDRDVRLGIIEKVPQGTSTEWCARMVVTAKKNGDLRRTVDLQQLNKATLRETHHTPTSLNHPSVHMQNSCRRVEWLPQPRPSQERQKRNYIHHRMGEVSLSKVANGLSRVRRPSQPDCGKNHWKLIFAGSHFTKDSESRYAPLEAEALAFAFDLKCCPSTLYTSPGKSKVMKVSDIASRNPVKPDDDESSEIAPVVFANTQGSGVKNVLWETVKNHAIFDEECSLLAEFIANGFPKSKDELTIEIRNYWSMKDDLYLIQSVPFKGKKMLIPASLRQTVLEGLHAAHQGVSSMLTNAPERFFWPRLDAAVCVLRNQSRQCNEQAPSQRKKPTISTDPPEYPFQQVAIDLFKLSGFGYMIYVDAYSGWIEVATVNYSTFEYIKKVLLMYFAIFGVPLELASDGGPPFDSFKYRNFLTTWNIHRRLSSAYYLQSNGRAEVGVKRAKRILLGNVDPKTGRLNNEKAVKALLTHRNTPCQQNGSSPAQSFPKAPRPVARWRHGPNPKPERKPTNKMAQHGVHHRDTPKPPVSGRDGWQSPSYPQKPTFPSTDTGIVSKTRGHR